MNEPDYKEFDKRYDKFKRNNLPTPFWDKERLTLEYVWYNDELDYYQEKLSSPNDEFDRKQYIENDITDALANIASTGFYYPYTTGYFRPARIEEKTENPKIEVGLSHSHSFKDVVRTLYEFPETFNISKEEEKFYSEQELRYLRRVQKYLLFIGLKDIEEKEFKRPRAQRYRNNKQRKYGVADIHAYPNQTIEDFISGKRNFIVIQTNHLDAYEDYEEFDKHNKKELIADLEDNIKIFVEYTHREKKSYKDIKNVYKNSDLKDDDKIIVEYFKILEKFD